MKKNNEKLWVGGLVIGFLGLIIVVLLTTVATPLHVDGNSMKPILKDNQYVLVNELSYNDSEAKFGDIVVAINRTGDIPTKMVKMVVGEPGDKIEFRNNVLFRNGKAVPEFVLPANYLKSESVKKVTTLKDGEYYLLGKNLPESADSRDMGAIPQEDLVGKVIFK